MHENFFDFRSLKISINFQSKENFLHCDLPVYWATHGIVKYATLFFHLRRLIAAAHVSRSQSFTNLKNYFFKCASQAREKYQKFFIDLWCHIITFCTTSKYFFFVYFWNSSSSILVTNFFNFLFSHFYIYFLLIFQFNNFYLLFFSVASTREFLMYFFSRVDNPKELFLQKKIFSTEPSLIVNTPSCNSWKSYCRRRSRSRDHSLSSTKLILNHRKTRHTKIVLHTVVAAAAALLLVRESEHIHTTWMFEGI